MKVNITIQLKNQAEINALLEIVSFYIDSNTGYPLLTHNLASDIFEELEKFKKGP